MNRREFTKRCAGAAVAIAAPSERIWHQNRALIAAPSESLTTLRDPQVQDLALRAVEAARAAGAQYADVRLTNTVTRSFDAGAPDQTVALGLSVRALVNGYWGWAATPMVSSAEAARVAQKAVAFATACAAQGKPRRVDFGTIPVVHHGDWMTPVKIDPFDLPLVEVRTWLFEMAKIAKDLGNSRGDPKAGSGVGPGPDTMYVNCYKQERLFASTEGSLCTQTVVIIQPQVRFTYRGLVGAVSRLNGPVQAGWERISETPVVALMQREMDRIDDVLAHPLPQKPMNIGRYDIVFTASAMAEFLANTLAPATQLDRALGYEANAGGTSYLGPHPLTVLGTAIASPVVTITADRSTPFALATTKWDDEGVAPTDFTLVKNGIFVDYQTTREQAAWLAPWYAKQGLPVHSHGCAMAPDALSVTMQHTPNLILQPGTATHTVDDLVASLDHGLLVESLNVEMDFQCNTGQAKLGGVTEIQHGKRVANLTGAGLLFRSPELWKNIQALGGSTSQEWIGGYGSVKGEPRQNTGFSIAAVPALIKQQTIIDPNRKA
jgi:TldD protein